MMKKVRLDKVVVSLDFKKAYSVGQYGECVAWDLLIHKPNVRQVIDVRDDCRLFKDQDVDFLFETTDRKFWKAEVKTDQQAHKTGNIAYEVEENGRIGCLEKTTADVILYYLSGNNKMYTIYTSRLRRFVEQRKFEIVSMGNNSKGYLIPLKDLLDNGVAVEEEKTFYKHEKEKK